MECECRAGRHQLLLCYQFPLCSECVPHNAQCAEFTPKYCPPLPPHVTLDVTLLLLLRSWGGAADPTTAPARQPLQPGISRDPCVWCVCIL